MSWSSREKSLIIHKSVKHFFGVVAGWLGGKLQNTQEPTAWIKRLKQPRDLPCHRVVDLQTNSTSCTLKV